MKAQMIKKGEYTRIMVCDESGAGGACHNYRVEAADMPDDPVILGQVDFQNGPIQEKRVNGVQNEDLLTIVIHRLQCFQRGAFACRENAIALTHLETALLWLEKRTADRKARGVEGKTEV
jgi:hypothetical protein